MGPSTVPVACMPCEGRLVSGAVPSPGLPSSGASRRGSTARVSRLRLVRAWGPSTGPIACARPCGPALRAVGVAEGRLRGGHRSPS